MPRLDASESGSELFDPRSGTSYRGSTPSPTSRTTARDGRIARVAFNRPEVRNAFRPHTVDELYRALDDAGRTRASASCCSPATARARRTAAGRSARAATSASAAATATSTPTSDEDAASTPRAAGRLHILEVQRLIRFMPKVVIAVVPGWAAGGGHSLHVVCDLTIASREHGKFKQTDADVGSLRRRLRQRLLRPAGRAEVRPRGVLPRRGVLRAQRAYEMGAVNAVVPHAELERDGAATGRARSSPSRPTAIRMLKFAFNAVDDGLVGQQVFAGEATRLAYGTDEAVEGRDAFLEKREPDWSPYPWQY